MAMFSTVLTRIDIEMRRLSLMADDDAAALPPFRGEQPVLLQVKDENGDVWSFRCRMRPGTRPKLLIDDSLKFVHSQGLTTGDEINLFREDDRACGRPDHEYKIEVIKKNRFSSHLCE